MNNNQYTNKHDRNSLLVRTLAEMEIQSVHGLRAAHVALWQGNAEYALGLPPRSCSAIFSEGPLHARAADFAALASISFPPEQQTFISDSSLIQRLFQTRFVEP